RGRVIIGVVDGFLAVAALGDERPFLLGGLTMKAFVSLSIGCVVVLLAAAIFAQDKGKEVTLKGTLMCAKCSLGKTTECTTAIQVKEGDKTVTYYLDDKGQGEEH